MPQIIVTADNPHEGAEPLVMFRERVSTADFESGHFTAQLMERLRWAVGDADEAVRPAGLDRRHEQRRRADVLPRASRMASREAPAELAAAAHRGDLRQGAPRSARVVTTAS